MAENDIKVQQKNSGGTYDEAVLLDSNTSINDLVNTKVVGINAQTGTTYTLVLTDAGKLVRCNNANAITLTVPKNSSVAFPTGAVISIEQQGAGVVTVTPVDTDVTINAFGGRKTGGQYAAVQIVKVDTNVWTLYGGVA